MLHKHTIRKGESEARGSRREDGERLMKKQYFVGYYNPSVILTYIGVICGFVSMYLSTKYEFRYAIFFLMLAGLCDMFDGAVARMVKRNESEKKFGIQLDSLCDLVSFGVTPAMIAFHLYEGHEHEIIGLICGLLLTICGVIRLAYFNVMEEERQEKTTERRTFYQGLPITCSAISVPVGYIVGKLLPEGMLPYFFSGFMVFTAFLHIYNIKFAKVHGKGTIVMILAALGLFAGVLLV